MSTLSTTTTQQQQQQQQHQHQRAAAASLQSHFTNLSHGGPLTTHLTDTNSIPILSTHPSPSNPGLSSLSSAFVQAHDTASRMGLGHPLRVTLATASGAAVIQTATVAAAPGTHASSSSSAGSTDDDGGDDYNRRRRRSSRGRRGSSAPGAGGGGGGGGGAGEMLVGTVIAPADRLAEARMASWGIEEVARRFQKSAGEGL